MSCGTMTGRDPGGPSITSMSPTPPNTQSYDPEAVRAKYLAERDRRLVAGRADIRDLSHDEYFARYRDDPFTTVVDRPPVNDDVDVVIVGGGIAGVTAGAQLRKAGIEKIRIVDQAGGIGGTWYWNRYPGVMCDVESYIYLPSARRARLRAFSALHVRRGDPPVPRFPCPALRPRRRRALPHRNHAGRMARRRGSLAHPDRPGRPDQLPLVRHGRGHPQPDEAPRLSKAWRTSPVTPSIPGAGTTTTPAVDHQSP